MSEVSFIRPPVVWLITDNKPGHRSQLQGLGGRLEALADARLVWVDSHKHPTPLWRAVFGLGMPTGYPRADIIIAAGTGTHRFLLANRRSRVLTVLLMRPAFPYNWIDAAIVPAHDNPPAHSNLLVTQGVLNAVAPREQAPEALQGLILVGGPSRHFIWDDDIIYQQVSALSEQFPEWNWWMSSSRRTPDSFIRRMLQSGLPNVSFYHHDDTEPGWINDAMAQARVIWVSPDSVSMVYEALTSGRLTGLFDLEPAGTSRVAQSILALEREGRLAPWTDRMALLKADAAEMTPLWEADRAARWVLQRWQEKPA